MSAALSNLLGIASQGAFVAGMEVGGPFGLAAGVITSGLINFFSDVFGGASSADYMSVTEAEISDAVNEIEAAVNLDITNLELSKVTAAQNWFSTHQKSTQVATYNPSVADVISEISDINTTPIPAAMNGMAFAAGQINNGHDTSLSTLGIYGVSASLLLNCWKFALSLRRVEDAKNIVAYNAANPKTPKSLPKTMKGYPEYSELTTNLDQILKFLKPQVDAVNQAFIDTSTDVSAVADGTDITEYLTQGQARYTTCGKAMYQTVKSATQLLPPSVYDADALQKLNTTYVNLTKAADNYKNL